MSGSGGSAAPRVGCQEPTFRLAPPYESTEGDLACELSAGYDMPAFEWQRLVLRDWLARNADGKLACPTAGLMVPRQNGKNAVIEIREFYGIAVLGETILHTTHEYQSAAKAFARLRWRFGERRGDPNAPYEELNRLVRRYTLSAGQMILELENGGMIEFRTRTADGGRGGTFDLLILDEAQQLTDVQNKALAPVNSAGPLGDSQTIYAGTPPKKDSGALVFSRVHDVAVYDRPAEECWADWSAREMPGRDDEDAWYRYNPSLGLVLSERALRRDASSMLPEEFAVEHFGFWPEEAKSNPISEQLWRARLSNGPLDGRFCYAVKFSADRRAVALAGGVRPEGGPTHVELISVTSWERAVDELHDWLMARREKAVAVVIDGITGAPALEARLLDSGFPRRKVIRPNGRQVTEATSRFYEAVRNGRMTHGPGEPLSASACGAVRRVIGKDGAWAFGSTPQVDSTPIEAAAWAWWAVETRARRPGRRAVAW